MTHFLFLTLHHAFGPAIRKVLKCSWLDKVLPAFRAVNQCSSCGWFCKGCISRCFGVIEVFIGQSAFAYYRHCVLLVFVANYNSNLAIPLYIASWQSKDYTQISTPNASGLPLVLARRCVNLAARALLLLPLLSSRQRLQRRSNGSSSIQTSDWRRT